MALLQHESGAAVLQSEAATLRNRSGAETGVVGGDEGARVSLIVRRRKVDSISAREGVSVDRIRGLGRVEELGARAKIRLGKQLLDGGLVEVGIGDIVLRIGESQAQRLDKDVEVLG